MVSKSVSFTEESEIRKDFKTWPKKAIKNFSTAKSILKKSSTSTHSVADNMNDLIYDLFCRFKSISDVDMDKCLQFVLSGNCNNKLSGYSVLNMILKAVTFSEAEDDNSPVDIEIDSSVTRQVFERAIHDFDAVCESNNVLHIRLLQQIMRAIESAWVRTAKDDIELVSQNLSMFACRCISLIRSRPNSKSLLGPAIRVANMAMEQQLLQKETIIELIQALSRSNFVFAASFIIEAMSVLSTARKVCPESLSDSEEAWVPLAVRALGSTSIFTRNLAFQMVQYYHNLPLKEKSTLLAQSLLDYDDDQKTGSEQVCRVVVRKMATIAANSAEDAKMMIQAWCLVLESASLLEDDWPLLDLWLDIGRVSFSKWPKTIDVAWQSILSLQMNNDRFGCVLLLPILAFHNTDDNIGLSRMIVDAAKHAPEKAAWEDLLEPLFKELIPSKSDVVLSSWAQLLEEGTLVLCDKKLHNYIEMLGMMYKQTNQQTFQEFETIWKHCVVTCSRSRPELLEILKFHYAIYAQHTSHQEDFLGRLTNCLLKCVPEDILSEKPKNSSCSYLTLVLLPVVTFLSSATEYMYKVLSQCESEKSLKMILKSLLITIETGNDTQNPNRGKKWLLVSSIIREYLGDNDDIHSINLLCDTLLAFVPIMPEASTQQWQVWSCLLMHNSECQPRVLSSLKKLPPQGLRAVLMLPKNLFREDKIRLIRTSLNDQVYELLQSDNSLADTDLIDSVARSLITQNQLESAKWAIKLINQSRLFVVAKHLLTSIEETCNNDLVTLWNTKVEPYLDTCPAFVPKAQAARLNRKFPHLKFNPGIIIVGTTPSANKRSLETTPLSSSKRQRRAILTGSMPVALSTPPASSDPVELTPTMPIHDELCSSPPRGALATPQTWRNSQERALTLKRILMGLNMEEASQGMSRAEKQMIYNLMFKSCVWLKTHLAETGNTLSKQEIDSAKSDLSKTISIYQSIETQEKSPLESNKGTNQEGSLSLSEDEDSDELDMEELDPLKSIKLEIA